MLPTAPIPPATLSAPVVEDIELVVFVTFNPNTFPSYVGRYVATFALLYVLPPPDTFVKKPPSPTKYPVVLTFPVATTLVKIPTLVILGCALLVTVPATVAVFAAPCKVPMKKLAVAALPNWLLPVTLKLAPEILPLLTTLVSVPTDVILGCALAVTVPAVSAEVAEVAVAAETAVVAVVALPAVFAYVALPTALYAKLVQVLAPSPYFTLRVSVSKPGSPAAKIGFELVQLLEVSRLNLIVVVIMHCPRR